MCKQKNNAVLKHMEIINFFLQGRKNPKHSLYEGGFIHTTLLNHIVRIVYVEPKTGYHCEKADKSLPKVCFLFSHDEI